MARLAGLETTTVREAVAQRVALLKARQDAGQLRPLIKRIDDALRSGRDLDGSLRLDPRDTLLSAVRLIDVGA